MNKNEFDKAYIINNQIQRTHYAIRIYTDWLHNYNALKSPAIMIAIPDKDYESGASYPYNPGDEICDYSHVLIDHGDDAVKSMVEQRLEELIGKLRELEREFNEL
jgi:hypothetical protein